MMYDLSTNTKYCLVYLWLMIMVHGLYGAAEIVETTLVVSQFCFLRVVSRISTQKETTEEIRPKKWKWPVYSAMSGKWKSFPLSLYGGHKKSFTDGTKKYKKIWILFQSSTKLWAFRIYELLYYTHWIIFKT